MLYFYQIILVYIAGANQAGPSSEKGKPQKRKFPTSSSKEGEGELVKVKKRRKNEAPIEESDPQERSANFYNSYILYVHTPWDCCTG